MRRAAVLVWLCAFSCGYDVLVGRNVSAIDGGFGGGAGGGTGAVDGGDDDGGLDGGGSSDGGSSDGGSNDGGLGDGGLGDGGAPDGGADAGPPDVTLRITGRFVVEQGDTVAWGLEASNLGGQPAQDVAVQVTLPLGVAFVSGAGCGGGNPFECDAGTVSALGANILPIVAHADAGHGWRSVSAVVSTSSMESNAANNDAGLEVAVTGVGNVATPIIGPRTMDVAACFGSNLTSFAMCTPPSLVLGAWAYRADGTIDTFDTVDAGIYGYWGQSPHNRNLAFRFYRRDGGILNAYVGAQVDAGCFQGVINDPTGTPFRGAWEGCLR